MPTFRLRADSPSLVEDRTYAGNVLTNDTGAVSVTQVRFGSGSYVPVGSGGITLTGIYGSLTIQANGSYSYTANSAQAESLAYRMKATDVFSYTAASSSGTTATTTLTFNISGKNDAPVLTDTAVTLNTIADTDTANAGQPVSSFLHSTDVDSGALSGIGIIGAVAGNGGWQYSLDGGTTWADFGAVSKSAALLLRATDLVRFVPNGADATEASFSYRAWDQFTGTAGPNGSATSYGGEHAFSSEVGTASITVTDTVGNQQPVAAADSGTGVKDNPITIDVLANDSDPDGGTLSVAGVTNGQHGTVVIQNNSVVYTPASGYTGTDAFTYTLSDGQGGTAVGNVSVTVNPPPPPPTSSGATTVTFAQGTNGYTGAVDTMLREHYPTMNFGDAFVISPESDSGYAVQGLLQFNDIFGSGAGQIPVGATIVSATLTLRTTNTTPDAGTINRMLVGWDSTATWSSLGSGVQVGTEASSSGAVAIGAAALGSRAYDVTASLQAWLSAGGTSADQNAANHGWLFNPTNTDEWNFASSESAFKPVLAVTYLLPGQAAPSGMPSVSISGPSSSDAQVESGGQVSFTLNLSQAYTQDVTVTYSTADGTAKAGSDYVAATGSVTFAAGETSKQIDVLLTNDTTAERLENFTAHITSATNATVGTSAATAYITDDDGGSGPMPTLSPSIVASYNLANGSIYQDGSGGTYGIGDPSGIAYIPSLGRFYIVDSEHDESPYFSNTNMFDLNPDGSFVRNFSLTSYTKEPTGIAYNPNDGNIYISDDSKMGVFWADALNPSTKLGFFDTRHLGFVDSEDPKIDPLTNHIYMLDGTLKQIVELTIDGKFVDSTPLPSIMQDAEALAYDTQHDVFFVASGKSKLIWAVDHQGDILGTIDVLSSFSGLKPKGLELAPSSDPHDGNALSLYVVDYGADQVNDGRLFEIHLGPDWFF